MNGFLVLVQLEDGADDPLAVEPEHEAGGGELGLVAQLAPGQAPQRLLETCTQPTLRAFAYVYNPFCKPSEQDGDRNLLSFTTLSHLQSIGKRLNFGTQLFAII